MEQLNAIETTALQALLVLALLSIGYGLVLRGQVARKDRGTDEMQAVWDTLNAGARAYLQRQLRACLVFAILMTAAMAASVLVLPPSQTAQVQFGEAATMWAAVGRGTATLAGAVVAYAVAAAGMGTAVAGSLRTLSLARKSYAHAMQTTHQASIASGLVTVGAGVLGFALLFLLAGIAFPLVFAGFALGGSIVALFLRAGGSIYTRGTSTETATRALPDKRVAEDPNNPAVIADMVGDSATDSAGIAADVFESITITLTVSFLLGSVLAWGSLWLPTAPAYTAAYALYPLMMGGVGLLASLVGGMLVRTDDQKRNARAALTRGFLVTALLAVGGSVLLTVVLFSDPSSGQFDWRPAIASVTGVALALALERSANLFVPIYFNPFKEVNYSAPIARLMMGRESSAWWLLVALVAFVVSLPLSMSDESVPTYIGLLYHVSLVGVGMLSLTAYTVAMESFGPAALDARRMGAMVELDKNTRNTLEDLGETGRMIKGIARGTTLGVAALATMALPGAIVATTASQMSTPDGSVFQSGLKLTSPSLFIGLFLGIIVPIGLQRFLNQSATRIEAQRATSTSTSDTGDGQGDEPATETDTSAHGAVDAVGSATASAQKTVVLLLIVAVALPALSGTLLGIESLIGLVFGSLLIGYLLTMFQPPRDKGRPSLASVIKYMGLVSFLVAALLAQVRL